VAWLSGTRVPTGGSAWLLTVLVAALLLVLHLSAALAAVLPPGAPLPPATVHRWTRRGTAVVGLSAPVWLLLWATTASERPGDSLVTYAAVAVVALLALAFWRAHRTPSRD